MLRILSRIVSPKAPKLHFLQNQSWLDAKFNSTTSSSRSKGNSFAVSYLIDICGFPPERAVSVSKVLNFKTSEKPELAFAFFKSLGFSQSQASSLIRRQPNCLLADPDKTLKPKIDFFRSVGFSNSDIRNIILRRPQILSRSLKNEIIPTFDFFINFLQSKDKLMKTVKLFPGILSDFDKITACNMKFMREGGVSESNIVRLIECWPQTLKEQPWKFKETLQKLVEYGFNPQSGLFVVACYVKICISKSKWAMKECIYKRWGWTDDNVIAAFRVFPWCMATSENKIDRVMDFLVNKMGYKSLAVVKCPGVLAMSMEKRIIPRGSVILVLKSKGLVDELSLSAIFMCNEMAFLDKFVYCHKEEADELLKLYHAKMEAASM